MRELTKLVWPFPQSVVHVNPSGGGVYVAHPVVEQRLLDVIGPVDFDLVEIVRGNVAGRPPNPEGSSARARAGTPDLVGVVVGVVCRMTATIDGRVVRVEEVGDCESPSNWTTDGQRMKDAFSDAYKRCAMRLGVGLHLWAGDAFYLAEKLKRQDEAEEAGVDPETGEKVAEPEEVSA